MADGLELVAIRIQDESSVIAGVVAAQSRRPVVSAAGGQSCGVKRSNLRSRAGPEAPMAPRVGERDLGSIYADVGVAVVALPVALTEPDRVLALVDERGAERRHDGAVEGLRACDVAHGDRHVIEQLHGPLAPEMRQQQDEDPATYQEEVQRAARPRHGERTPWMPVGGVRMPSLSSSGPEASEGVTPVSTLRSAFEAPVSLREVAGIHGSIRGPCRQRRTSRHLAGEESDGEPGRISP